MPEYDLRHERAEGRCAWCWGDLGTLEAHTAVSPLRPPYFDGRPLRFHHACWRAYSALSGLAGTTKGTHLEVTPAVVEAVRIHAGLSVKALCQRLRISYERYSAYLGGDGRQLTDAMVRGIRDLAAERGFGRLEPTGVDWTLPHAVFSLRMHLGITLSELAARLGMSGGVANWEHRGVPQSSLLPWNRLDRVAREAKFDAGSVLQDRDWTPPAIEEAIRLAGERGLSKTQFAIRVGVSGTALRNAVTGHKGIGRHLAWRLTFAASRLGISLPPPISSERWAPRTAKGPPPPA